MPGHLGNPFFRSRSRPGLFAREEDLPEEKEQKKLSFFDKFASVFVGPRDARLSDEQNTQARDQALTDAGLAILAAGGRTGLDRASTLTALAEGAQAGRASGTQARRGQVIGGLAGQDPSVALPQFRQLFIEALQSGDKEGAQSIATVIQAMEARQAKLKDQFIYRNLGDDIIVIDPTTATEVGRFRGSGKSKTGKPEVVSDPRTGQNILAIWRPESQQFFDLAGNVVPNAEPKITVAEKQDDKAGQISSLRTGLEFIKQHGRPTPSDVAFGVNTLSEVTGGLVPAVGTEWLANTEPLVLILTRLYQGGRPTDKDIVLSRKVFIPQVTDTNAAVEAKIAAIERALNAFNAGRRAPAFGGIPQGVDPGTIIAGGGESSTPIADRFRDR